jgi:hypothetical protein
MVYSEPRRVKEPSIAEQYFERAIRANPFDHYGHELLADILRRRIATRGVDLASRPTIERGISEAQKAIEERETSGEGHLLRAELLTMLLEIERDAAKRREYRAALSDDIDQAARFLPKAFQKQDPDLTWVQAVDAARRLGEDDGRAAAGRPHGFDAKKRDLETTLDNLLAHCANLERRWVNQQRVYHIQDLEQKATLLKGQVEHATPNNWRDIIVRFW